MGRQILLYMASVMVLVLQPSLVVAAGVVIDKDTIWRGDVVVDGDVLVRTGATLTVAAGTRIRVLASESTKTDPEYLSSLTEITVRGVLKAQGTSSAPVVFVQPGTGAVKEWAGILVDGGRAELTHVVVEGAESGVTVITGAAELIDTVLRRNRYGLSVVTASAHVRLRGGSLTENDYGLALLNGAVVERSGCRVRDNEQKDVLVGSRDLARLARPKVKEVVPGKKSVYTNESLLGTVVWKDHVVVKGVVRVPAKSKLIIMPGAVIEFSKRDSNGDGYGENGLLVMGMLVAKGLPDRPIVFRSAEAEKSMADWDAINIYSSDGVQNLIEYARIENAYRGLHFHFSNVTVRHTVLRDNYRGLQFQESLIDVSYNDIYDNKSAVRARDSEVRMVGNRIYDNYTGPNIFRITGEVRGNVIAGNLLDGLRVREGALRVRENHLIGNRYGLTVAYANHGSFTGNVVSGNIETGITLKGTDSVKVSGNAIQGNGGNGISVLDTQAVVKGNLITGNGERGIGVISFNGVITGNNFMGNRLYAIGLDGGGDVSAPGNWWGGGDLDRIIYDHDDDSGLGRVDHSGELAAAAPFVWPTEEIAGDTAWLGAVVVPRKVYVKSGAVLTIRPGTTVAVAKDRGVWVNGTVIARGEPGRRITFTVDSDAGEDRWHQVMVEKGKGEFAYCDFTRARIALHSHYSAMSVEMCRFTGNEIGYRFKGGPVTVGRCLFRNNRYGMVPNLGRGVIRDSEFSGNEVGIIVREEKDNGLLVTGNNFFDNSKYNLRMGAFNPGQDVNAPNNWWGPLGPEASIYDADDEPGIGRALVAPPAAGKLGLF